eukprot:g352.t1
MWGARSAPSLKYKAILLSNPNDAAANEALGSILFKEKRYSEAIVHLKRAVASGEGNGSLWLALARALHMTWKENWETIADDDDSGKDDRLEDAKQAYDMAFKFVEVMTNPAVHMEVAKLYEDFGSFEQALELYSSIVSSFPQWPGSATALLRAASLFCHPGVALYSQAQRCLQSLLTNPPEPYFQEGDIMFMLARVYELQGNSAMVKDAYAEAFRMLNKSLRRGQQMSMRSAKDGLAAWYAKPATWDDHAKKCQSQELHALAADSFGQLIQVASVPGSGYSEAAMKQSYIALALSLGRIQLRQQCISVLERVYNVEPYTDHSLRKMLAKWDPEGWAMRFVKQEGSAIKIQACWRGMTGRQRARRAQKRREDEQKVARALARIRLQTLASVFLQLGYKFGGGIYGGGSTDRKLRGTGISTLERSELSYQRLVALWGRMARSSSNSLLAGRLPHDTFHKPESKYFVKDIQTSLLKQELETHHRIPHPHIANRVEIEKEFVRTHAATTRLLMAQQEQHHSVPLRMMVLTLPTKLRSTVQNYSTPFIRKDKAKWKASHLTGKRGYFGPIYKGDPASEDERERFWGFPRYFAPGAYGPAEARRRMLPALAESKREELERSRMGAEEEAQEKIDMELLVQAKHSDYDTFEACAKLCGALPTADFLTSPSPGRLYAQRIYVSASRLQIWWLILIPLRTERKYFGAMSFQRLVRGHLGRREALLRRKVRKNLSKMMLRSQGKAFAAIRALWHKRKSVRRLVRRALHRQSAKCFFRWVEYHNMRVRARLAKMERVAMRLRHAKAFRVLTAWNQYVYRIWRVRLMARRSLLGAKEYAFEVWAENVGEIMHEKLRLASALTVQSTFRMWKGRQRAIWRRYRLTTVALTLQKVFRGHLGRLEAQYERRQQVLQSIRMEKHKDRSTVRERRRELAEKEADRCMREDAYAQEASETARREYLAKIPHRKTGRSAYTNDEKMLAIAMENKSDNVKDARAMGILVRLGRTFSRPTLAQLALAREQLSAASALKAAEDARVRFRNEIQGPKFACAICQATFGNERSFKLHICEVDTA